MAINVALAVVIVLRPSSPATIRGAPEVRPAIATTPTGKSAPDDAAVRAAIDSGDKAALQAVGFSPDVVRDLIAGHALSRLFEKDRASRKGDARWWRSKSTAKLNRVAELKAQREFSDAMFAAFGEDPFFDRNDDDRLGFLPANKRDVLRRITQDYAEMQAKFGAEGVPLASDREKQKMLRAEHDRDIAALLSPEEFAEYEMRTSSTAAMIGQRYGDAIASEDEFRKIYSLQKAFEEKYPPQIGRVTPEMMTARADGARQLQDDIRAAVGDEQYAALRRAADNDVRAIDSLASRLNLGPDATDRVIATRDSFATESQRINADTSLTPAQRRAQLQDLGHRARTEVAKTLGNEATDAYAQRSAWLNMLQGGMAFSTTPQPGSPGAMTLLGGGGPSVFPVLPAAGAGGGRQMIINGVTATSTGSAPVQSGGYFVMPAGGSAAPHDDVQVMTFTATSSDAPPTPATPPATPANPATPKP